jgi:hypothetical protein
VTKVPDLLSYPIYTIIGSGQTQGLSYDKYVGYWGDISHRYLVAAGSNNKFDNSATFAEACGSNHSHSTPPRTPPRTRPPLSRRPLARKRQVELLFDPEPMLRFTPHIADDASAGDIEGADAHGRWGPWREQVARPV